MTTASTAFSLSESNLPLSSISPAPLQLMDPSPLTFQLHFPLSQKKALSFLKKKPRKKGKKKNVLKSSHAKPKKLKDSLENALKSFLKRSQNLNEKRLNMTRNVNTPSFILQQKSQNRMNTNDSPIVQQAVAEALVETLKEQRVRLKKEAEERNKARVGSGRRARGRPVKPDDLGQEEEKTDPVSESPVSQRLRGKVVKKSK